MEAELALHHLHLVLCELERRLLEGLHHHAAAEPAEVAALLRRPGILRMLLGQVGETAGVLLQLAQNLLGFFLRLHQDMAGAALLLDAELPGAGLRRRRQISSSDGGSWRASASAESTTYSTRTRSGVRKSAWLAS